MQNVIFQNDIHYTTGFKCFNHLNTEAGKARANQQYYIIYVLCDIFHYCTKPAKQ